MKLVKTIAVIMAFVSATAFADTQAQCPDIQGTFVNKNQTETYEISHAKKDADLTYTMKITHSANDARTLSYVLDLKSDQDGGALGPVTIQALCDSQAFLIVMQTLMGTDTHKFTLNQDNNLVIEEFMSLTDGQSKTVHTETYVRQ